MKRQMTMILCLTVTAALATPLWAQEPEEALPQVLITNVDIFDGKSDKLSEDMSVLVEGNLIKTVSNGAIEAPGATVIDGGGRVLMPGLIDAHADLLIVGGNLLEDIAVIGANPKWFDAEPREGVETIRVIMKDGKIYKNTLPEFR